MAGSQRKIVGDDAYELKITKTPPGARRPVVMHVSYLLGEEVEIMHVHMTPKEALWLAKRLQQMAYAITGEAS